MLQAEKPDAVVSVLPVEKIGEVGSLLLSVAFRASREAAGQIPGGVQPRQTGTPHMVSINRMQILAGQLRGPGRRAAPVTCAGRLREARREEGFPLGNSTPCRGCHASHRRRRRGLRYTATWNTLLGRRRGCWLYLAAVGIPAVRGTSKSCRPPAWWRSVTNCSATTSGVCNHDGREGQVSFPALAGHGDVRLRGERGRPTRFPAISDGSYEETSAFIRGLIGDDLLRPSLEEVSLPQPSETCGQMAGKRVPTGERWSIELTDHPGPRVITPRKGAPSRTRANGFTLIELLVVIAIIAILAAILFPVFAQARRRPGRRPASPTASRSARRADVPAGLRRNVPQWPGRRPGRQALLHLPAVHRMNVEHAHPL